MPNKENGHHGGERQSDLAVMDANEFKQKKRLEDILNTIRNVQEVSDEGWADYAAGKINHDGLNIKIQGAVKKAIRESNNLLEEHYKKTDGDEPYWSGDSKNPIGTLELPDNNDDEVIVGLEDFRKSNVYYSAKVEERVSDRNAPPEVVTRTLDYTMPRSVSYEAYLRLKMFLSDVHDLEIIFEEMDDKLADAKPASVELPEGYDIRELEALERFNGNVDARAVSSDDD